MAHLPAQTQDGYGLHLYINIGLVMTWSRIKFKSEGGLISTEIPFLAKDYFPSEKEQEKLITILPPLLHLSRFYTDP